MATFTEEEEKKLIETFKELAVKPKFDTKEDLESWLKDFGKVKVEPSAKADPTATVSLSNNFPRISLFYGDNVKGEVSFPQWMFEVKSLLLEKQYKPEVLAQAIRKSLRGEASNLLRRLGIGATIPQILEKFESVYGAVDTKENVLAKFYSARQEESEDVSKWSSRLEDILSIAVEKNMIKPTDSDDMLRHMFWQGLKPSLKDISGYKFEQCKDFDELRVELRKIEQDHSKSESGNSIKTSIKSVVENKDEKSEMKETKSMLQSLDSTVKDLERKINKQESTGQQNYKSGNKQGGQKGNYNNYPKPRYQNDNQPRYQNDNQRNFNGPRYQKPYYNRQNQPNQGYRQQFTPQSHVYQAYGQFDNTAAFHNQNANQFQGLNQNQNFTTDQQTFNVAQAQSMGQQGQNVGQSQNVGQNQNVGQGYQGAEGDYFNRGPLCFNCKQYGHYQWRCPVTRFDHSRKHLN